MTCPGTEEGFRQVEEQVTKKIYNYISKTKTKASTCSKLMVETSIFEYKDAAFPLLKERNRAELSRGLISDTIVKKLQKFASRKVTNNLLQRIIRCFHKCFKKYVWKPRCEKMLKLEERLNITKSYKMLTNRSPTQTKMSSINAPSRKTLEDKKELLRSCMNRCKNQIVNSITKGTNQAWKSVKVQPKLTKYKNAQENVA
jgi:hypothetical protein